MFFFVLQRWFWVTWFLKWQLFPLLINNFLSLIHHCSAAFGVKTFTYAEHLASSCTMWTQLSGQTQPRCLWSFSVGEMSQWQRLHCVSRLKVWKFETSMEVSKCNKWICVICGAPLNSQTAFSGKWWKLSSFFGIRTKINKPSKGTNSAAHYSWSLLYQWLKVHPPVPLYNLCFGVTKPIQEGWVDSRELKHLRLLMLTCQKCSALSVLVGIFGFLCTAQLIQEEL